DVLGDVDVEALEGAVGLLQAQRRLVELDADGQLLLVLGLLQDRRGLGLLGVAAARGERQRQCDARPDEGAETTYSHFSSYLCSLREPHGSVGHSHPLRTERFDSMDVAVKIGISA